MILQSHSCASCVAGLSWGSSYEASFIPGITAPPAFAVLFLILSIFFFFPASCLYPSSWFRILLPLGGKEMWVIRAFSLSLCLGKRWAGLAEVQTFSKIFKFCFWAFPPGLGEAVWVFFFFPLPVPSHSRLGRRRESRGRYLPFF